MNLTFMQIGLMEKDKFSMHDKKVTIRMHLLGIKPSLQIKEPCWYHVVKNDAEAGKQIISAPYAFLHKT